MCCTFRNSLDVKKKKTQRFESSYRGQEEEEGEDVGSRHGARLCFYQRNRSQHPGKQGGSSPRDLPGGKTSTQPGPSLSASVFRNLCQEILIVENIKESQCLNFLQSGGRRSDISPTVCLPLYGSAIASLFASSYSKPHGGSCDATATSFSAISKKSKRWM